MQAGREIKFRAWDSKGIYTDDKKPSMIYDVTGLNIFDEIWHSDEYIKLQFTGLHDKNGKPIYEGDIIRYHVEPTTKTKVVIFREGMFATDISSLKAVRLISEVIGNVWENSELLEVKN